MRHGITRRRDENGRLHSRTVALRRRPRGLVNGPGTDEIICMASSLQRIVESLPGRPSVGAIACFRVPWSIMNMRLSARYCSMYASQKHTRNKFSRLPLFRVASFFSEMNSVKSPSKVHPRVLILEDFYTCNVLSNSSVLSRHGPSNWPQELRK